MAKRQSKKLIQNVTKERFEEAMSVYALADSKEAKINATIDEKVTKIRETYATDLVRFAEEKEEAFQVIQSYCEANKELLFVKKKSFETVHGTVGFRTGTPALKTKTGFTWASVLQMAKALRPDFVRSKEELDKELILASREEDDVKADMAKIGVEVKQDESFFVELKKETEEA